MCARAIAFLKGCGRQMECWSIIVALLATDVAGRAGRGWRQRARHWRGQCEDNTRQRRRRLVQRATAGEIQVLCVGSYGGRARRAVFRSRQRARVVIKRQRATAAAGRWRPQDMVGGRAWRYRWPGLEGGRRRVLSGSLEGVACSSWLSKPPRLDESLISLKGTKGRPIRHVLRLSSSRRYARLSFLGALGLLLLAVMSDGPRAALLALLRARWQIVCRPFKFVSSSREGEHVGT